jgi:tRNA-Thr(GGU) m(6)t(6)A37 methyltransferase TsaA
MTLIKDPLVTPRSGGKKKNAFFYTNGILLTIKGSGLMNQLNKGTTVGNDMQLQPVGVIRNNITKPSLVAGEGGISMQGDFAANRARIRAMSEEISEVRINEELTDILDGIEEFSHLMILYWGHRIPAHSRALRKVHPMGREDFPEVGIFATRSPARPNPVLLTVVRLCGKHGNVLEVSGLDAVDGSPVIDIKPYVREFYPRTDVRIPGWMQQIIDETGQTNP